MTHKFECFFPCLQIDYQIQQVDFKLPNHLRNQKVQHKAY